nr:ATP synthase F1 subunit epsilon [Prevotella sp.]
MLKLKIISPEKIVFNGNVENITVPGTLGSFEILNDHAPIISSLENGTIEYTTSDGRRQMNIKGGFVEVKKNEVNLCVEV